MQENSYIQVLIQSLHQKVEALDSIIEKNQEQYEILSAEEADMDACEKNIDENNYSIQEEGWLGILFLVGTIFSSELLLYGFIELIPVIFLFFTIRTFTASTVEPNFVYLSVV